MGSRPQPVNLLPEKKRRSITKKSDETKPIGRLFTTLAVKNKPKTNPNKANFAKQIGSRSGTEGELPASCERWCGIREAATRVPLGRVQVLAPI